MKIFYTSGMYLLLSLGSQAAIAQHLFGNPSCIDWPKLTALEKTTWLNAYLVPLNLTNVSRKKPKIDKFSQLPSLDSAVLHVDLYCSSNSDAFASVGAIQFLDELTSASP